MPAAESMIRTVPGANVGPAGGAGTADGGEPAAVPFPSAPRPTSSAATTATTRPRTDRPITQALRPPPPVTGPPASTSGGLTGSGGARSGDDCTVTPGPAGVATSDQLAPFHQRACPGAPSGSGYQPGGGAVGPDPVTAPP